MFTLWKTAKWSMRNKTRAVKIAILAMAMMASALLSSCALFPQEEEVLAPPLVKPKQEEYQLAEVKRGDIVNRLKSIGTLVSVKDYSLFFESSGRLDSITVKNGDEVKKGQVVAQLDTGDLTTQIELAQISVQSAQIELDKAKDRLDAAKAAQSAAQKQLSDAKAALAQAQAALDQEKAKEAAGDASADVAGAENALAQAQSKVADAQKAVDQAPSNVKNAQYDVSQQELNVKAAQIRLSALQRQMANAQLVSPIDGVVVFISDAKKGDIVQPYQILIQVADPHNLQVSYDASLLEDPSLIKPGMKAELVIDGQQLTGEVVSCPYSAPADIDPKNKNQVLIKVDNLPQEAKLGSSVDISITLQQKSNTLIVPRRAVRTYMGKEYVQVLEGTSKRELDVQTGIKSATEVEILSGLKEGQQVILR